MLRAISLVSLLAFTGCGPARSPIDASPEAKRRPDGIAVDPLEYPPEARETADASAGVVALRTPLGPEAAKETVKSFLIAISKEDLETVRKLMAPDATSINPQNRAREPAFYFFSRRFGRLDYFLLSSVSFWQEDRMELYRATEAATLWADTVGPTASAATASTLPGGMNDSLDPSDVVLRVPLTLPRVGASQLLGEEMVLLLRRSGGRYVIFRIVEEFVLPQ